MQAKYTRKSDGNINVRNSERKPGSTTIDNSVSFPAYPKNDRFPILLVGFLRLYAEYQIVDTDFTDYAIVRSCQTYVLGIFHDDTYWVLLRSSTPNPAIIANAKQTIKDRSPHYDVNNL